MKPAWEGISIEPPVYVDGQLRSAMHSQDRGFGFELCSNITLNQMLWRKQKLQNPLVTLLDNDALQTLLCPVRATMDAKEIFLLAFQNTAGQPEPFFLSGPHEQHYTENELDHLKLLAVDCAKLGLEVELCPEIVARHPALHAVHEGCRHLGLVVAAPYYHRSGTNGELELHGVFIGVGGRTVPLTEHAWARVDAVISQALLVFQEAGDRGKVAHYDPQPLVDRHDGAKMLDGVRVLTRDNFVEYMTFEAGPRGPDAWYDFLDTASRWLGFADPHDFHPKRLYRKLQAAHDAKALQLAEETQKAATTLTSSVISQSWLDTLGSVLGGITTVIPDAAQVYFVATHRDFDMMVLHGQAHPLSREEERALIMVAQLSAVSGEAIFDAAPDLRPVFNHLRGLIGQDVPIVAIPVFAWEADKTGKPNLHGVFVAIRRQQSPEPTAAMRLAWILAAQYLLSPLAAAHEKNAALYQPIDLQRRFRAAYSLPSFPASFVKFLHYLGMD